MHVAETALVATLLAIAVVVTILFMQHTAVPTQHIGRQVFNNNTARMQFCLNHTQTWEDLRSCYKNV